MKNFTLEMASAYEQVSSTWQSFDTLLTEPDLGPLAMMSLRLQKFSS